MANTVLCIIAERSLATRAYRGSCRERLKDLTVHKTKSELGHDCLWFPIPRVSVTCAYSERTHTPTLTHTPVSIKEGIRN